MVKAMIPQSIVGVLMAGVSTGNARGSIEIVVGEHMDRLRARKRAATVPRSLNMPESHVSTPTLDRCKSVCDILTVPIMDKCTAEVSIVGRMGSLTDTTRDELRDEALRWGAWFAERIEPGDRVALCVPTSTDFLHAFFGVLYAGGVAVPLASMVPMKPEYIPPFLEGRAPVINDSGAKLLVTLPELVDTLSGLKEHCAKLQSIICADDIDGTADGFVPAERGHADLAMLQYTSGSTGNPKGVELTHHCLLWNLDAIRSGIDVVPGDYCVSWLPLYHDMGLIGGCLYPLSQGMGTALMATEVFLTDPSFWMQAMGMKKATMTVAPNFGFALSVKRVNPDMLAGVDLSAMRVMLCGAEPIDPEILAAYQDKFASLGLQPNVILPVYGLAEATLAATFSVCLEPPKVARLDRARLEAERAAIDSDADDAIEVVSVGTPLLSNEIRIVSPETGKVCGDDVEGEVLLQSPSVMRGYFKNPEASAQTVVDGWLHTGDLGFVRDGDLYITGRIKDLIITYGRNFYPHDIERIAQRAKGVRTGCVVAFAVHNEEESTDEIAIVAETRSSDRKELIEMRREMRKLLINLIECNPKHVWLVPPGQVPKTTSGKLRRNEARSMFVAETFERLL